MTIPAGQLRHRLRCEALVQQQDPDFGGPIGNPQWVKQGESFWARRRNTLRATAEAVSGGTTVAPLQVMWDMRPRRLDPSMRLVGEGGDHEGVIYDIKNVGISNDRSEMAVTCTSGASNG